MKRIILSLPEELISLIDERRLGCPRAEFIRECIRKSVVLKPSDYLPTKVERPVKSLPSVENLQHSVEKVRTEEDFQDDVRRVQEMAREPERRVTSSWTA